MIVNVSNSFNDLKMQQITNTYGKTPILLDLPETESVRFLSTNKF